MIQAFWALIAAGVISGTPPEAVIVDIFPSEKACLEAKPEVDKILASPKIGASGSVCIKISPNKGNPT